MDGKYLVLGSEGIIGSAFCDLLKSKRIPFIRWDIKLSPSHDLTKEENTQKLKQAIDDVKYILFAAYDIGGSKFITGEDTSAMNNNLKIMANVFPLLKSKKFIFCSSTMAHITDNWYGVSKRLGELYTSKLNGVSVRLWNVYGYESGISPKSRVITDYLYMALKDQQIRMMTDGKEKRQMLHNKDCAEALLSVFEKYDKVKVQNSVIDISSGEWVTILEIANLIAKIIGNIYVHVGKSSDTCHTSYLEPSTEIINTWWKPKMTLEEGISHLINTIRKEADKKKILDGKMPMHIRSVYESTIHGNGDSDHHLMTLFSIAIQIRAKRILELGVRGGSTTLPLLLAAQVNKGTLTSVDINSTEFVCPEELRGYWTFVQSDAVQFLSSYGENIKEPWDLVFVDDWHAYEHVKKELSLLDFQISPKSVILLHDLMYADYQPHYHSDISLQEGQWAKGGPYRAVAELNPNFWEFSTIPTNNGLTILRKKYSRLAFSN